MLLHIIIQNPQETKMATKQYGERNVYRKAPQNPKNNEFAGEFDPASRLMGSATNFSGLSRGVLGGLISEKMARTADRIFDGPQDTILEPLGFLIGGVMDTIRDIKKSKKYAEVVELDRQQSMLGSMPGNSGIMADIKAKFTPEKKLGPFDLVNAYHRDTINQKAAATNADGDPVTVNAMGIDVNGRIYMVPGYDRETGKIYTQSEEDQKALKEAYIPLINKGVIPSVAPLAWDGDPREHPARVAAQENHSFMDAQADEAMAAVNPDFDNMEESYELPNLRAMPTK